MHTPVKRAMKYHLHTHLGFDATEMHTKVHGLDGKVVQEWDAIFKVDDVLYLCEAKHIMCVIKVLNILEKLKTFKEQFQKHAQEEFSMGINKVVGVACGTSFPPNARERAHKLGLVCVYPTGWRYYEDNQAPKKFKIEFNKGAVNLR
jgi:hypothetical protein